MANTLKLKRSSVAGKIPLTTDLQLSEMAVNTTDGRLFTKKNVSATDYIVEFLNTDSAMKPNVRAATTANITLSGTQVVDGVTLAVGDRVLVKNQSSAATNGIYLVASGAWTRTHDLDTAAKAAGAMVAVAEGTVNGGKTFDSDFKATDTFNTTSMAFNRMLDLGAVGVDVQAWDADLDAIAALAGTSGFLKKTGTNTWTLDTSTYLTTNQSITLSGDISGTGTTAITTAIGANKVTNAMLAQVATGSILGRVTAATGNVETLTGTQATTLLDTFTSTLKGLVPASGGGTTNFLRADGTWAAPGAAAGVSSISFGTTGLTPNSATTGAVTVAGTLAIANGGTGQTTGQAALTALEGYLAITSSASAVTLTASSPRTIYVTGSTAQTIVLPDVTTLQLGWTYRIINANTSGAVTVQSSGLNAFSATHNPNQQAEYTVISTTGTTTASWVQTFTGSTGKQGFGSIVYNGNPGIQQINFIASNAVTAGTNAQGQGALTETVNIVTTAANNPSGVTLPTSSAANWCRQIHIINRGANPINVYPASGGTIDTLAANAPVTISPGRFMTFWNSSTTQWWSSTLTLEDLPGAWTKKAVLAATTANVTLSGGAPNTLDGVTLAANDRVLVKDQTASAENGIYRVATLGTGANGTWTRVPGADTAADIAGATVSVDRGTVNGGQIWTTYFKDSDTLGTTAMPWYRLFDTSQTIPTANGGTPTGTVTAYAGLTAPSGWLLCAGQSVSRTTYAALFAALSSNATVTITIATPGVVTWTGHTLVNGNPVTFNTTGALPTGITAGTTYYVVSAAANTFQIAATVGGAAIATSGTQSGTHTCYYVPYGTVAGGTTVFNLPDLRGRVPAGQDNMNGTAANRLTTAGSGVNGVLLGTAGGAETHTLTTAQLSSHNHAVQASSGTIALGGATAGPGNVSTNSGNQGSGSAHNNTQPTIIMNYIIKT